MDNVYPIPIYLQYWRKLVVKLLKIWADVNKYLIPTNGKQSLFDLL